MSYLLTALLLAAPPVVLSDCETVAGWSGGATLIPDAHDGQHAVRFAVPAGKPGGPSLDFKATGAEPRAGHRLAFWYRFNGKGASNLMIKLVSPFTEGMQGTWDVVPDRPADGQWHAVSLDLSTPWMRWGETPDLNARVVIFRTDANAGSELTLDLDQVQLIPTRFQARVLSSRLANGKLEATVELTNPGAEPVTLDLAGQAVPVAAGATVKATASLPVDLAKLTATPLLLQTVPFAVQVAGEKETLMELSTSVTAPMTLPAHPRLLLSDAEIPAIKARAAANPVLADRLKALLQAADGYLTAPVSLPPRGGQWYHWYACKKDGANLQTVSATEHKCPVCGTVYTGWPYDDVILSNVHNGYSRQIKELGVAYVLSRQAKYADKAREILLAYAAKYDSYPLHDINGKPNVGGGKVGPQTLDESTWLIPVAQGADLIWNQLSQTDRATLETKLFRPAAQVIAQHRMGIHNIQCWKNSAVGLTGLLLDDPALVADAVTSEHGFKAQMTRGVNLDGQWYEGAWGYHFYTMSAVVPLAEAGERCGLGLYAFESGGHTLRKLFEGPLNLAMPNFVLPNFSDSGFVNVIGSAAIYEHALRRYGDPRFAELISHTKADSLEGLLVGVRPLPAAPPRASHSANYTEAGYAVLQQGEGEPATWACMKYGPHGGGHGHPDKLNVILYARGKVLGYDPGTGKYGVPLHAGWQQTSIAHNTLTVDEANQAPTTGKSLAFVTKPGWSAALSEAGPIYEGVTFRRAVALVGTDLVLMLDQVKATKSHTLDLAWHNAGTWATAPTGAAFTPPDKPGYRYLANMVSAAGPVPLIGLDPMKIGVGVAALQPGETLVGTGAGQTTTERVPCVIRRTVGKEAVVGWALRLDGQVPQVSVIEIKGGWILEATAGGQTTRLTVQPDMLDELDVG